MLLSPALPRPDVAVPARSPRSTPCGPSAAGAVFKGRGHESREARRGAAGGRLDLAVDRLGTEHEAGTQTCLDPAPPIDAAEGTARLRKARGHGLNLPPKPAHGQENAPSHVNPEGLREDHSTFEELGCELIFVSRALLEIFVFSLFIFRSII